MKKYYLIALLLINIVLLITLIAVAIFTAYPEIHKAFQNFTGGSGPCIHISEYWKIHLMYVGISPLVAIVFMPFIRLMDDDEE